MAKFILRDVRIVAGGVDLSSNANTIELAAEVEDQDATSFVSEGWTEILGGLKSVTISSGGQWSAGDVPVDNEMFAEINGGVPVPWLVAPHALTSGALAYSTNAMPTTYTMLGEVGSIAPWEAEAMGSGRLTAGTVEHAAVVTGPGSSAGRMLATAAGQRVYVSVHVLAVAGGDIAFTVDRDADSSFATPATAASSATYTAPGSEILAVDPASDTWYRVSWSGTATSAQFAVVFSVA